MAYVIIRTLGNNTEDKTISYSAEDFLKSALKKDPRLMHFKVEGFFGGTETEFNEELDKAINPLMPMIEKMIVYPDLEEINWDDLEKGATYQLNLLSILGVEEIGMEGFWVWEKRDNLIDPNYGKKLLLWAEAFEMQAQMLGWD